MRGLRRLTLGKAPDVLEAWFMFALIRYSFSLYANTNRVLWLVRYV